MTDKTVNLSDIPSEFATGATELTEPQKAQIKMTYWVLLGAAGVLLASGGAYIWTENGLAEYANDIRDLCAETSKDEAIGLCKEYVSKTLSVSNSAAREVFEFCKNFVPPIVTLVLGAHYVTRNTESI